MHIHKADQILPLVSMTQKGRLNLYNRHSNNTRHLQTLHRSRPPDLKTIKTLSVLLTILPSLPSNPRTVHLEWYPLIVKTPLMLVPGRERKRFLVL
jgi:hypothetical protein